MKHDLLYLVIDIETIHADTVHVYTVYSKR